MKTSLTLIALSSIALLSACAERPDSIAATPMPESMYSNLSCSKARAERTQVQSTLNAMEAAQNIAATGDAIGVFLIGVPWSSLSGKDKAGQIGTEKGKLLAIDARLAGCLQKEYSSLFQQLVDTTF